jgi:hypothetical protein
MKSAGSLFGGGSASLVNFVILYLITIAFATAQYPWVTAVASNHRLKCEQKSRSRKQIRLATDLQMMAVSATCVGISALNSVGIPSSRFFLLVLGLAGATYYLMVNNRWLRWHEQLHGPAERDSFAAVEHRSPSILVGAGLPVPTA